MPEGYFNPWRSVPEHGCRTCRYAMGTPDGWHLWCERHRIVIVFPCGLWERAPGADDAASAAPIGVGGNDVVTGLDVAPSER